MESFAPPVVIRQAYAWSPLGFASTRPSGKRSQSLNRKDEISHLTRFASFSSVFIASTSALARSPGVAFWSQTVLDARRPSTQLGNSVRLALSCASAEDAMHRPARSIRLMLNKFENPVGCNVLRQDFLVGKRLRTTVCCRLFV